MDFHHRYMTCPSYQKTCRQILPACLKLPHKKVLKSCIPSQLLLEISPIFIRTFPSVIIHHFQSDKKKQKPRYEKSIQPTILQHFPRTYPYSPYNAKEQNSGQHIIDKIEYFLPVVSNHIQHPYSSIHVQHTQCQTAYLSR